MNLLRDQSAALHTRITMALLCVFALAATPALADDAPHMIVSPTRSDIGPKVDIGKGGHCVRDPKFMLANHMFLIMHQREQTLRRGIRGGKYSLAKCVYCHASKADNSVIGRNQDFCQGCHVYAAVKIDCFECHSSKASERNVDYAAGIRPPPSAMNPHSGEKQ